MPVWVRRSGIVQCETGAPHDSRKKIIEIVCNAACEDTETLEFRCLTQLFVELLSLGNIACDFQEASRFPVDQPQCPAARNMDFAPICARMQQIALPTAALNQLLLNVL